MCLPQCNKTLEPVTAAHAYNPSTWKVQAGDQEIKASLGILRCEVSLGYTRPCLRK